MLVIKFTQGEKLMICKKCGKYNLDVEKFCKYCGTELQSNTNPRPKTPVQKNEAKNKFGAGIVLALLGLIGLIIGLMIYYDPEERETFFQGWGIATIFIVVITVIIVGVNYWKAIEYINNLF